MERQRCSCGAVESEYFKITSASWDVALVAGTVLMPEQEANARLIVAAPDLLAACKAAIEQTDDKTMGAFGLGPRVAGVLLAAIAKANGATDATE